MPYADTLHDMLNEEPPELASVEPVPREPTRSQRYAYSPLGILAVLAVSGVLSIAFARLLGY